MGYRYRLYDAKQAVASAVNLNANDTSGRLVTLINRSAERLLYGDGKSSSKWQGTYGKYRICISGTSCLTLPREIETVEAWALDCDPHTVRGEWYEFLELGPGLLGDKNRAGWQLIDDGEVVSFDQPAGTGQKLAVFCDVTEANGASILVKYYREDTREKQRTTVSGMNIEGEIITFAAAGNYVLSTETVMPGGLYGIIKPVTKGVVRLFAYDTVAMTYKPLAVYEPDEQIPVYRQVRIPGLAQLNPTGTAKPHSVTVLAKFRFIPARVDNDFLPIPNLEAIRLGAQAILREESNDIQGAAQYWSLAFNLLNAQLAHYIGSGQVNPIRFIGADTFGGGIPVLR